MASTVQAVPQFIFKRMQRQPSAASRYAMAVLLTLVATAISWGLKPWLNPQVPYLPFVLAVVFAAGFGGLRTGLLNTGLSTLACEFFFIPPIFSFEIGDSNYWLSLMFFLLAGSIISLLVGWMGQALIAVATGEDRYRNLFESMDEGFATAEMIFDKSGHPVDFRYIAVNPAFARQTGLSVESVVGRTLREIIPDIEPLWAETYGRIVRTGQGERLSYRVAALARDFDVYAWRSGPQRFAAVFSDVTERKQKERELLRLGGIIESADEVVVGEDLEGRITSWNPAAERLYGYSAAEMLGQPFSKLLPPGVTELPVADDSLHLESARLRKDGTLSEVAVTFSPIYDRTGALIGRSRICRDITEQKHAESKILLMNATLEKRVLERTVELREANRELEAFSYSVSHDLRAPLRAVEGFSSILLRDYTGRMFDDQAADLMNRMSAACRHMGQLISDLLTLSRIARQGISLQSVDVGHVAEDILSDLKGRFPERSVDVQVESGLVAEADASLIRIMLENLIGNAWKFTSKTHNAKISIGLTAGTDEQAYFVTDNGAGFDMAYADELFTPFRRLHSAEEFEGTGIGLATVKRIIRRHGGSVWVEAKPGLGASFHFTLGRTTNGKWKNHTAGGR